MKSAVTVLLLFVFLSGESFAGYSTGFRRTPKPKHPDTAARPVIFPTREHTKHHPHWKEPSGGSVETDKVDEGGNTGIVETGENIGIVEDGENIGIIEDGGIYKPDDEGIDAEEPKDVPENPGKEDIPVKPDDFPDRIPPIVIDFQETPRPFIGTVDEDGKFPEIIPPSRPDIPESSKDYEIPEIPSDPHPEQPIKEDTGFDVPGGIANDDESSDSIEPSEVKPELVEPYPLKVGNGNIDLNELMQKLELSRFLHLVEEANLQDLLTGEGPVTIFAPSDFALSKLDADTIRKLATNKELLRQFVLYHCVDGQIYGQSFEERDNSAIITKFDRAIHINKYGNGWFVNGIPITSRDQICRNGVIHVLDNSLYPIPTGNLLETLEKFENFKIYTELIRNAKLENELTGEVIYTIFVPTDVAFSKLPPANLEWLKWDIPAIKRMFRQLTVNGAYYSNWIPNADGQLSSIDGTTSLSFSGYPDSLNINGVELSQHDITASNGCIQAIDDIWFLSELGVPSSNSKQKKEPAS